MNRLRFSGDKDQGPQGMPVDSEQCRYFWAIAVLQLVRMQSMQQSGLFPKRKPPCKRFETPHELETRSKKRGNTNL
jgi:hypothetical protein